MERDFYASGLTNEQLNFNSHAHVERDPLPLPQCLSFQISTHTLTWSVTLGYYFGTEYKLNFNSHAHVERDSTLALYHAKVGISTHTLTWSVTKICKYG